MAAEPLLTGSRQSIAVVLLAIAILPLVVPLKYILVAVAVALAALLLLPRTKLEVSASETPAAEQEPLASPAAEQPTFDSPAAGPAPAEVTLTAADGIAREDTQPDVAAAKAAPLPPPNGKSGPVVGGAAILARLRCVDPAVSGRYRRCQSPLTFTYSSKPVRTTWAGVTILSYGAGRSGMRPRQMRRPRKLQQPPRQKL